jgi:iron-sulfur cluster assembly accessory protein
MINLSQTAAREITRLKSKYSNPNAFFRLGVESRGCCDLSYTMAFEDSIAPEDAVYESEGIQVAIDPFQLPYLGDLTLDYSEDLMGGGFRFHNPNAAQTCSCGNSFSVRE